MTPPPVTEQPVTPTLDECIAQLSKQRYTPLGQATLDNLERYAALLRSPALEPVRESDDYRDCPKCRDLDEHRNICTAPQAAKCETWQHALPKITPDVLQQWSGAIALIEHTDEGPQWDQNAVDFAGMLQETALSRAPPASEGGPLVLPTDSIAALSILLAATVDRKHRLYLIHAIDLIRHLAGAK